MKMMMGAMIMAIMLAFPTFAMAQSAGANGGMKDGGPYTGYGQGYFSKKTYGAVVWGTELNLSDDQIQKLASLQSEFLKNTIPLMNQFIAAQADMQMLWSQSNPDPNQIAARQQEIDGLREHILMIAIQYRLEAQRILTPDQLAIGPNEGLFDYRMGKGG